MQHTRQHDRRDGIVPQGARGDDLARGLETEQDDWQQLAPVYLFVQAMKAAFDELGLDKTGRKQHDGSLDCEAEDEGAPTAISEFASRMGKDGTSGHEGDDGDETFRPAVRAGCGVGR